MPDRTDIDALLVGALYGELSPADEERLAAHLESHPADRTALADLTRTRAAVHDSRVLAVQLEPPQAISAVLLQEAARRAARPGARDREAASWFQRFTRSFLAHPAIASAAMLVLVLGVAGTLYVRGVNQFAPSEPSGAMDLLPSPGARQSQPEAPAVPAAAEPPAPAAAAVNARAVIADGSMAADSSASTGSLAGSGGGRADGEDVSKGQQGVAKQLPANEDDLPSVAVVKAKTSRKAGREPVDRGREDVAAGELARNAAAALEVAAASEDKPAKTDKKPAGVVVRTPELAPKELKGSDEEKLVRSRRPLEKADSAGAIAMANKRAQGRGAGLVPAGAGGAAPAAAAATGPTPAPASTMASVPVQEAASAEAPTSEPVAAAADASYSTRSEPKVPSAKPAPAGPRPRGAPATRPPPSPPAAVDALTAERDQPHFAEKADRSRTSGTRGAEVFAQKSARDKALLEWARKQHGQVIAFVSSNNCRAAASAAIAIYNRAPDYYTANVVTDRSIRPCLVYLNSRREREDRSRAAAKSATPSDTPPTSPARK